MPDLIVIGTREFFPEWKAVLGGPPATGERRSVTLRVHPLDCPELTMSWGDVIAAHVTAWIAWPNGQILGHLRDRDVAKHRAAIEALSGPFPIGQRRDDGVFAELPGEAFQEGSQPHWRAIVRL